MTRSIRKKLVGIEFEAHPVVFPVAAVLIVVFVVVTASMPGRALMLFDWLQNGIASRFAWL